LELNEIDRLLMTRYKEHEDLEADLDDEENSRSSRDRRRYTEQIERLEQQLEGLRLEYEVATSELHRLRRNRDSRGWTPSTARRGHAMRWSHHEAHRPSRQDAERVCHPRIKLDELRDQRSSLRKDLQELRATLEDRNSRLEDM